MKYKSTLARGLSHAWPWTKPIGSSPTASRLLRYSLLCMLVLLGSGSMWADDATLAVDFEEETTSYSDWTFTNFATKQTNSGVAAHGGSYFGSTGGKTSGSLVTKEKLAKPKNIKFYISKTSTNSTASSWIIKVSTDGETWTNVKTQSASAVTKGTWTEVTQDLTSYTNVYVGIFYEGTTAIRTIDDVTLTYENVNDTRTATTIALADGYATTGVEGKTVDMPTATVMAGETAVTGAEVTWKSSDESVAKIEGNKISLLSPGTATITATYAGDDSYKSSKATYDLTVTELSVDGLASMAIIFKDSGSNSDSGTKITSIDDIISEGNNYVSSIPTADNVYNGRTGRGLKLGASSKSATLILTLAEAVKPIKITFDAMQYSAGEASITVNGKTITNLGSELATYSVIYDGETEVSSIEISTPSKRAYITNVKIYYEPEATPDPLYILGVEDLNEDNNTWSLPADMKEMTWDAENKVYTYELNNTSTASFCFSTNNEVSDWNTFNSTYRWAIDEGDSDFPQHLVGVPLTLLKVNGTIKLPAGTWTISIAPDNTSGEMGMTITGEATPVEEHTYIVAGSEPEIFGTSWDGTYEANKMTKQTDGTYQKTYTVDQAYEDVQLKVVKDGSDWIGDDIGNNVSFNLTGAGNFTVTINPETNVVSVTGDIVQFPTTFEYESVYAVGDGLGTLTDWSFADGNKLTESAETPGVYSITYNNVPASEAVFKFALDGKWDHNFGGTKDGDKAFSATIGTEYDAVYDGANISITTTETSNITLTLDLSNFDFTTKEGAKFTITSEVTKYTVTFAGGDGVQGVAPAAIEVEAGSETTAPRNTSLYKEGYTLIGWESGNAVILPGAKFTPETDMELTAKFGVNEVSLADREDAVTITYALDGTQGNHNINNSGVVVTQATIGDKIIDVAMNITAGSLVTNNGGWHQVKNNFKATIPSAKGATVVINTYDDPTNLLTFGGSTEFEVSGSNHAWTATYTATADATSLDIAQSGSTYWNKLEITLPKVESEQPQPTEDVELFKWTYDAETTALDSEIAGTNGKITLKNSGTDAFSTESATYTEKIADDMTPAKGVKIGKNTQYLMLTLTEGEFQAGDQISVCGYNEIMFCTSADRTATIGDVATGSGKSDYKVGTFTIPEDFTAQSTLYLFRKNGSGTGVAAIQAIRPGFDPNAVATPEITPATGTYTTDQEVAITCATEGATIYYATDGNNPTTESTVYTEPFTITETTTIKAFAIKNGYVSEIAESVITIKKDLQPGESNLEWDYTEKDIPTTSPDNGLNYAGYVNDAAGTNNGLHGVKLNSSGYAWFTKNPVEGKLTLTFGNRKTADAFTVNVYSCDANGTKGDKIGEVSVAESPGTGSIDIAADVTGIYIERSTSAEGVLQKIVFKEKVARTFKDFEITNEQLKGTIADMNLPQGVTLTGTQPEAGNNAHGYINASISVPTDGGAVKFTFGGCQYANKSFTVTNSNNETIATLSNKTTNCYHQDASVVTYFYTGEATTLTFSTIPYLPYFKAEATDVQEVTVTFKDQNGTELGKKTVFEGEAIGEVPYTEADLTIANGEAFRGWVYASGVKVQATDIVSGSITVKASVTPIETVTEGSIQTYDLTKSTFYPEDHETIKVENAAWHDSQHGFSVASGSTISVQTAGKAQVVVTLCQYSAEGTVTVNDANGNPVGEGFNAKVATCGTTAVVNYDGEATWLTFTFSATAYIHSIKVYNVTDFVEKDEESGWYIVPANDGVGLVLALNAASQEADGANIFLPNGTYDLGETVLTAIGGKNVSLIGESMDGVIIKNAPPVAIEGLKTTATLHNTGENLYLQDLTIQNALDYYSAGSAGRGIAFWDEGKHTIAKNVKLLSYQDTYLSTVNQQFYWETSEIHGAVDFICGGSDVFFESTKIVTESRAATGKSGEATITAPQPGTQEQFGYVFNNCTIENNAAKFNLGRAWGGNSGNGPKQAYLNTTIMQPDEIISTRFTTAGMNEAAKSFKEYNSKNNEGTVISPTSNILKFTHSTGDYEYETILSETEAANYALDKVFPSWSPATDTRQIEAPVAELKDGVITWEKVDGATAYALFNNGSLMAIVDGETTSYTIEDAESGQGAPALLRGGEDSSTAYTIRAANGRGGFGVPKGVTLATGIQQISKELGADVKIYDLNGRRVTTPTTGVYIINGKKVVIK